MTQHEKAGEARKGLIDSVKGKAKEFLGAVSGNDSLTAEGQLQQEQARERKHANTVEAVADAETEQARAQVAEVRQHSARERSAVEAQAATAERAAEAQRSEQRQAAEQVAAGRAAEEKADADLEAHRAVKQAEADGQAEITDAARQAADAVEEQQAVEHITTNAHDEADRIRSRAAHLTKEADLP